MLKDFITPSSTILPPARPALLTPLEEAEVDAQSPTQRESSLTALADRYAPGRLEAEAVELICAHDEEPPLQAAASLQLAIAKIQRVLALKYAVCLAALLLPSCVALDSVGQISASYGGVTVSYAKPRPNVTK